MSPSGPSADAPPREPAPPTERCPARTCAAVAGALAVLLGAFGAHGLKDRLSPEALEWWRTGVLYHLVHALALLATGLPGGRASAATWSFTAGIVLFSGTLYAMALGGPRWLGAVTPLGGTAFIVGWLLLLRRR